MPKHLLFICLLIDLLVPASILSQENPSGTYKKYGGTIGTSPVVFDLIQKNNKLSGTYYYTKIGTPIEISGEAKEDNKFAVTEYNQNYEVTGNLTFNYFNEFTIEGQWENPKTKKTYPIKLTQQKDDVPVLTLYRSSVKNCDNVEKNKLKPANEIEYYDTICSTLSIDWVKVKLPVNSVQEKINQKIKEFLVGNISKSIDDYVNTYFSSETESGFNRDIICNPATIENPVLSFSIVNSEYFFGAAHPGTYLNYINFDISTGNVIALDELFIVNYKQQLNQIAEKKFIQLFGTEGWDFTPGNFKNTENYLITRAGLVFTFNQYEIGPYAAGAPTFLIPYKEIKHLIKENAIVSKFY